MFFHSAVAILVLSVFVSHIQSFPSPADNETLASGVTPAPAPAPAASPGAPAPATPAAPAPATPAAPSNSSTGTDAGAAPTKTSNGPITVTGSAAPNASAGVAADAVCPAQCQKITGYSCGGPWVEPTPAKNITIWHWNGKRCALTTEKRIWMIIQNCVPFESQKGRGFWTKGACKICTPCLRSKEKSRVLVTPPKPGSGNNTKPAVVGTPVAVATAVSTPAAGSSAPGGAPASGSPSNPGAKPTEAPPAAPGSSGR